MNLTMKTQLIPFPDLLVAEPSVRTAPRRVRTVRAPALIQSLPADPARERVEDALYVGLMACLGFAIGAFLLAL